MFIERSMGVLFRLTFVRHGETYANKEFRIQGRADIALNEVGEEQAIKAGKHLRKYEFTRTYTSSLKRAHKTCELILGENQCNPPCITVNDNLLERNFGCIEGLCFAEANALAKSSGTTWTNFTPEGAETLGDLQARLVKFFRELCQSVHDKNTDSKDKTESEDHNMTPSEHILVVGHGLALKMLFLYFYNDLKCDIPGDQDSANKISPNAGISEFTVRYSPKKYDMKCMKFHDASHLLSE